MNINSASYVRIYLSLIILACGCAGKITWEKALAINTVDGYVEYINTHPNENKDLVDQKIIDSIYDIIDEAKSKGAAIKYISPGDNWIPGLSVAPSASWHLHGGTINYQGMVFISDPNRPLYLVGDLYGKGLVTGRGIVIRGQQYFVSGLRER